MRTVRGVKTVLAAALVAVAADAKAELVDRVAAVVNDDIIALSEVESRAAPELARAAQERNPNRRAELRDDILRRTVDELIGEKLLETELRAQNIEVTDQEVDFGIEDVKRQNGVEGEQFEQLLRSEGYTLRYGIVHVDFETQQRLPKDSAHFLRSLSQKPLSGI